MPGMGDFCKPYLQLQWTGPAGPSLRLWEMVRQAGDTGIKMNISHVHVMNMARDGAEAVKAAKETMDYFDGLVASGIDLSYDVIPSASCSDYTLTSCGYYLRPLVLMAGTRKNWGNCSGRKLSASESARL